MGENTAKQNIKKRPEQRRLRRHYILAEVKLKPLGVGTSIKGSAVNINRGGLCVYVKKKVKVNDEFAVRVVYIERGKTIVTEPVTGSVRWVQEVGDNYAIGMMFNSKIDKKHFPSLLKCLQQTMFRLS